MMEELTKDWRQRGRPDDIPLDIWNAAVAATSVLPQAYGWRKITASVARTLLAERRAMQLRVDEAEGKVSIYQGLLDAAIDDYNAAIGKAGAK